MVGDARADAEDWARRGAVTAGVDRISPLPAGGDLDVVTHSAARTTAERAARSEQMLARSGIGPGHPSLYPSAAARPPQEHL